MNRNCINCNVLIKYKFKKMLASIYKLIFNKKIHLFFISINYIASILTLNFLNPCFDFHIFF